MSAVEDPFEVVAVEEDSDVFGALAKKPLNTAAVSGDGLPSALTAILRGFDFDDRPLIAGLPGLPHEVLPARSTVPLQRSDIGSSVAVVFEQGDARRPIVFGVVQSTVGSPKTSVRPTQLAVHADDERIVINAEREITLSCGKASITLTRAGKVIIKGSYIVSRSSGYNKIKGAAIDIN